MAAELTVGLLGASAAAMVSPHKVETLEDGPRKVPGPMIVREAPT